MCSWRVFRMVVLYEHTSQTKFLGPCLHCMCLFRLFSFLKNCVHSVQGMVASRCTSPCTRSSFLLVKAAPHNSHTNGLRYTPVRTPCALNKWATSKKWAIHKLLKQETILKVFYSFYSRAKNANCLALNEQCGHCFFCAISCSFLMWRRRVREVFVRNSHSLHLKRPNAAKICVTSFFLWAVPLCRFNCLKDVLHMYVHVHLIRA